MTLHRGRAVAAAMAALLAVFLGACSSPGARGTAPSTQTAATTPPGQNTAATDGSGSCPSSGAVAVSSASLLKHALADAKPGTVIVLAPGVYTGHFVAAQSGTQSAPVMLCGPRSAILDGGSITNGYTLHLDHASWWRLEGFTVRSGQKGIMADGVSHDLLTGLYVHSTGDEAIHLRDFSSHNTVSDSIVRNTGLLVQFFGEGIYVGTAHKNWCRYSGCQPDASDDNLITGNDISGTTAENIDIKEGTTGGTITGNHLDGAGMVASAATAWLNVKGNRWTISGNTGVNSVNDGLQVHKVYAGWGYGNVFRGNKLQVNGPGYGIYVQSKHLQTVVGCDNQVSGAGRGLSTIACSRS